MSVLIFFILVCVPVHLKILNPTLGITAGEVAPAVVKPLLVYVRVSAGWLCCREEAISRSGMMVAKLHG